MEWKKFEKQKYDPLSKPIPPYDGIPFLACIYEDWVGEAVYARHYDASIDRCPSKYEFFYVIENPEESAWKIRNEEEPFPITHWMPLPKPPKEE